MSRILHIQLQKIEGFASFKNENIHSFFNCSGKTLYPARIRMGNNTSVTGNTGCLSKCLDEDCEHGGTDLRY